MPTINQRPFKLKKKKAKPDVEYTGAFDSAAFYNSWKWRKLAKRHRRDNPLCAESARQNVVEAGQVVDHIIAIVHGGAKYDPRNFQTLSRSQHGIKTKAESAGPIYKHTTNEDGELIPVFPLVRTDR